MNMVRTPFQECAFEEVRPATVDYCSSKPSSSLEGRGCLWSFFLGLNAAFHQRKLFGAGSGMAAPSLRGSEAPVLTCVEKLRIDRKSTRLNSSHRL